MLKQHRLNLKTMFSKNHGVAMSELKFIYLAKFMLLSPTFFNLVHRKNTKRGMRRYYHEVAGSLSLFLYLPNMNLFSAPDSTFISLTLTRKSLHGRSTSFSPMLKDGRREWIAFLQSLSRKIKTFFFCLPLEIPLT